MTESRRLVVSCEHASNRVPPRWRVLFRGAGDVLDSHRGLDVGAAHLARYLAGRFQAPVHLGAATRLLVDLNRSPGHPALWSTFTRKLPAAERRRLAEDWYRPYRRCVTEAINGLLDSGQSVLHLSVHSFTPVLDGRERLCDIGLLYDPRRPAEKAVAAAWRRALIERHGLRVRRNYPYRGTADGFTTWLRRHLGTERYAGLELEVNQRLARSGRFPGKLELAIADTLSDLLARR